LVLGASANRIGYGINADAGIPPAGLPAAYLQERMMDEAKTKQEQQGMDRFEVICGVLLALFAAILAWADVGGSNVAEDRGLSSDSQTSAYSWYQSKGIKQSLAEGQRNTLSGLLESGTISADKAAAMQAQITKVEGDIERYKKEKDEILKGSKAVGKDIWAQDVNGEMGKIIGADEYKARVERLNEIDNIYDNAGLFLQLCLVMGALSLVFKLPMLRFSFVAAMVGLGCYGFITAIKGYMAYLAMG
jgi:hypothetical protein